MKFGAFVFIAATCLTMLVMQRNVSLNPKPVVEEKVTPPKMTPEEERSIIATLLANEARFRQALAECEPYVSLMDETDPEYAERKEKCENIKSLVNTVDLIKDAEAAKN